MEDEIQYYDHYEERLKQTQKHKAQKFVDRGCVKYNREGCSFICEPIPGYNTRTYQLKKRLDGRFRCNCQFMTTQEKKVEAGLMAEEDTRPCSHICALIICFREKRFSN